MSEEIIVLAKIARRLNDQGKIQLAHVIVGRLTQARVAEEGDELTIRDHHCSMAHLALEAAGEIDIPLSPEERR